MNPNQPPPRRRIEIVPLGEPQSALAPPPPRPRPQTAWSAPAVRSTAHPAPPPAPPPDLVATPQPDARLAPPPLPAPPIVATSHAPLPEVDLTDAVVVDLDAADVTLEPLVDLTDSVADSPAMAIAELPVGASKLLVLGKRRERLRDLLAREREELANTAPVVSLHPAADLAPFPLPEMGTPAVAVPDTTDSPRRVPKGVRPDAAGRPLADDVAAAIARLTGAPDRQFEIVPLDDPTPTAPVLHLPVPGAGIDLRDQAATPTNATTSKTHPCPACATPGVLDVIDRVNGVAHYSCGHCFRTWNESADRR